ncbi:hypothetical protein DFP72DRAFT_222785 [Ephemerocybe angulata]|uniref:G domain-containing protein n=1 Tax=Ephemerocybe angulata TaxID=980116 RepID=A0A8H6I2W1_9AGAR|nr:hypothetical protein DFP72DRAFT_222785 [Tulosesus angulatus]
MEESTIVLLGRSDAGKTTFVKAVQHAVDAAMPGPPVTEEPTLGIMEYKVPLPDGRSLIFLDTPGFDGYQPGERAMETEEILQMLDEHLEATGNPVPVSHVLVFADANDMATTEFKGRARRAFVTPEEVQSKEESLYAIGREVTGSLMEYLHDGRSGRGDDALHFRSGLRSEAYSSPQDIILKLFAGPGSDNTLEERLAAVTKERDELAARYALLLQEQQATTTVDDAAPPQEAIPYPANSTAAPPRYHRQVLGSGACDGRRS